jgi:hypothetical protein
VARRGQYAFSKRQRERRRDEKTKKKQDMKALRDAVRYVSVDVQVDRTGGPSGSRFDVSSAAASHLAALLTEHLGDTTDGVVIRIEHDLEGLALVPGRWGPHDITFRHGNLKVLALEDTVAQRLTGRVLDIVDEPGDDPDEPNATLVIR